jgi:hypothetical protein
MRRKRGSSSAIIRKGDARRNGSIFDNPIVVQVVRLHRRMKKANGKACESCVVMGQEVAPGSMREVKPPRKPLKLPVFMTLRAWAKRGDGD